MEITRKMTIEEMEKRSNELLQSFLMLDSDMKKMLIEMKLERGNGVLMGEDMKNASLLCKTANSMKEKLRGQSYSMEDIADATGDFIYEGKILCDDCSQVHDGRLPCPEKIPTQEKLDEDLRKSHEFIFRDVPKEKRTICTPTCDPSWVPIKCANKKCEYCYNGKICHPSCGKDCRHNLCPVPVSCSGWDGYKFHTSNYYECGEVVDLGDSYYDDSE